MCCEETSENIRPGIKDESPRSFLDRVGFRRTVPAVVALLFLLPSLIPAAQAETVVTRKRIGNNSEAVTYVTTGQWKNRAVAIDGNDVLAINLGVPSENTDGSLTSSVSTPSTGALRGPGWKKIFDILPLGAGAFGPDQFVVRVKSDTSALKIVSRTGTPDSSILPNATLPVRFPDLPLSSPVTGSSVQLFDSGAGPRIFTGGEIYDSSGMLLHIIDRAALGITVGVGSGTWISGDTFAVIDDVTSTLIIFTLP